MVSIFSATLQWFPQLEVQLFPPVPKDKVGSALFSFEKSSLGSRPRKRKNKKRCGWWEVQHFLLQHSYVTGKIPTSPLKFDGWKMKCPFEMIPFQGSCQFSRGGMSQQQKNHHPQHHKKNRCYKLISHAGYKKLPTTRWFKVDQTLSPSWRSLKPSQKGHKDLPGTCYMLFPQCTSNLQLCFLKRNRTNPNDAYIASICLLWNRSPSRPNNTIETNKPTVWWIQLGKHTASGIFRCDQPSKKETKTTYTCHYDPIKSILILRVFPHSPSIEALLESVPQRSGTAHDDVPYMAKIRSLQGPKKQIWSTSYGGFLKWWYPTTMGFPTKNDHFGVFWR